MGMISINEPILASSKLQENWLGALMFFRIMVMLVHTLELSTKFQYFLGCFYDDNQIAYQ